MTRPNGAVPKAVPSSVAPSAQNSVKVLTRPQLGPYKPATGSAIIPEVSVPEYDPAEITPSPMFGGTRTTGMERESGSGGAPTVPDMNGVLFRKGPIDEHYQNEFQGDRDPYRKINNPPTRGMFTWVKDYVNGIATSQDVDNVGNKVRHPQQRTSWMRITTPPHADGYSPETSAPHQLPQTPNTYKYGPQIGSQAYGVTQNNGAAGSRKGVLNRDTFGAGQTAGGIGGNQYTPTPGPPDTTSTANQPPVNPTGMPSWG